jgi:hypothetical protein
LEFFSPYPLKEGALPGPAVAYIAVKNFGQKAENSAPIITPNCVSTRELDYQIDRLQGELELIRQEAKKRFSVHDEREQERRENYHRKHSTR